MGSQNGSGGGRTGMLDSREGSADQRMEQIVSAIKDKDSDALKSLFSKKALDEAVDIDSEIEGLFDFIQGDVVSWVRDGYSGSGTHKYGEETIMNRFGITLTTDENTYSFYIIDYNDIVYNWSLA